MKLTLEAFRAEANARLRPSLNMAAEWGEAAADEKGMAGKGNSRCATVKVSGAVDDGCLGT